MEAQLAKCQLHEKDNITMACLEHGRIIIENKDIERKQAIQSAQKELVERIENQEGLCYSGQCKSLGKCAARKGKVEFCSKNCPWWQKLKPDISFAEGQQSILSQCKEVDLDEKVDKWLCVREGTKHPKYQLMSFSNQPFSQFIQEQIKEEKL